MPIVANSTHVSRLLRRTSLDDAALTARHLQPSPRPIAPDENSRAAGDPDTTRPPPDSPHARERCGSADLRSLRGHRHRELALPPRTRPQTRQAGMTPRPGAAPAAIATNGLALRARPFASTAAATSPLGDQATSRSTTTDEKWGQIRPSRWGQAKSSFSTRRGGALTPRGGP